MSHQVLARKWRPRSFATLVGQDHVVRALTHALDSKRLHHAYLFTGTRGVGKTTIARILAKAVNCEVGMSATPCGVCGACVQIDTGRFIDYLEIDAASNRGVDEMVQLLDNAAYAPTAGRYKVYVIDEVHMLSTHAFNAMLKTLEEPPGHALFVLATTDPKKVPVTVLSRCMQFNLRNMRPAAIASHLAQVLAAEGVEAEPAALALLGAHAGGSMRDALSLCDQAIAFGAGAVRAAQVAEMLGAVDARHLDRILEALAADDGPALVAIADEVADNGAGVQSLLTALARRFADIALAQAVEGGDDDAREWAARFSRESLQVYYQITIHGVRDLALAPDDRAGLAMTLLRLHAFTIADDAPAGGVADTAAGGVDPKRTGPAAGGAGPRAARAAIVPATSPSDHRESSDPPPESSQSSDSSQAPNRPPNPSPNRFDEMRAALAAGGVRRGRSATAATMPAEPSAPVVDAQPPSPAALQSAALPTAVRQTGVRQPPAPRVQSAATPQSDDWDGFDGDWPALAATLDLSGMAGQFARQSQLVGRDPTGLVLRVPIRPLADPALVERVRQALAIRLGREVRLTVEVGDIDGMTAQRVADEAQAHRLQAAREALEADPFVKTLIEEFDAEIVPGSIRPLDPPSNQEERNA